MIWICYLSSNLNWLVFWGYYSCDVFGFWRMINKFYHDTDHRNVALSPMIVCCLICEIVESMITIVWNVSETILCRTHIHSPMSRLFNHLDSGIIIGISIINGYRYLLRGILRC